MSTYYQKVISHIDQLKDILYPKYGDIVIPKNTKVEIPLPDETYRIEDECYICEHSTIGRHSLIGKNVIIGHYCKIGEKSLILDGGSIGCYVKIGEGSCINTKNKHFGIDIKFGKNIILSNLVGNKEHIIIKYIDGKQNENLPSSVYFFLVKNAHLESSTNEILVIEQDFKGTIDEYEELINQEYYIRAEQDNDYETSSRIRDKYLRAITNAKKLLLDR